MSDVSCGNNFLEVHLCLAWLHRCLCCLLYHCWSDSMWAACAGEGRVHQCLRDNLPEADGRLPQGGAKAQHHPVARRAPAPQAQQGLLRGDRCVLQGCGEGYLSILNTFIVQLL